MSDYEARKDQLANELAGQHEGAEYLHVEQEVSVAEFPPHTCQLGPVEGPCRACELLEQWRYEPDERQVNDWNIHNDHAQGNEEYSDAQRLDEMETAEDYNRFEEEQVFQDHEGEDDGPFELAPFGGRAGEI